MIEIFIAGSDIINSLIKNIIVDKTKTKFYFS